MDVQPKVGKIEVKKVIVSEQKTFVPPKEIKEKAQELLDKKPGMGEREDANNEA